MSLTEHLLMTSYDRMPLLTEGVEVMKSIALSNRFALKNLITLYNLYRADDPQLQSKDAQTAMQAILQAAQVEYPDEATVFGRMTWDPDVIKFMEFLGSVGDKTLAQFLGISSENDIPGFQGKDHQAGAPGPGPVGATPDAPGMADEEPKPGDDDVVGDEDDKEAIGAI